VTASARISAQKERAASSPDNAARCAGADNDSSRLPIAQLLAHRQLRVQLERFYRNDRSGIRTHGVEPCSPLQVQLSSNYFEQASSVSAALGDEHGEQRTCQTHPQVCNRRHLPDIAMTGLDYEPAPARSVPHQPIP